MSVRRPVLHLIAPGDVGGAERVVQSLSVAQHCSGVEVVVAAVVEPRSELEAFARPLETAGIEIVRLGVPPRKYLLERAKVARLLRERQPAVVHTHGYRVDVVDAGVARRIGIATVATVHGFTGGDGKNRFYEWLQLRALKCMDSVVAVSRALADHLESQGVSADRLHTVPNAYVRLTEPLEREAARRALGVGDRQFRVGWVGRLSYEKGPDVFLQALAKVKALPFTVSIFGSGPERQRLEKRANQLGVNDRIQWHEMIKDAARYFRAFDLLVLSSRTEGTPMVLLEAMAVGVPAIATDVGGVPDLLSPREGVLVPPGDAEAIADAMRSAFDDRQGSLAKAQRAQIKVDEYTAESWVARYEAVYRQVAARKEAVAR